MLNWQKINSWVHNRMELLSDEERKQGEKLLRYEDRERFFTGRIAIKYLLRRYMDQKMIEIQPDAFGKLHAKSNPDKKAKNFNISHSGEWVMLGIADQIIGVDIQEIIALPDYDKISGRYFSSCEYERIHTSADPEITFFEIWSAKEAYLKARGIGLRRGMSFFSVLDNKIKENDRFDAAWKVYSLSVAHYAAYVVINYEPIFLK